VIHLSQLAKTIEPALDPKNIPVFQLDWEVTLKCNLDCSYCNSWGHDNSTAHPQFEECKKTVDFMFRYVDLYMQKKAKWTRSVVLNVYGGESLFHPNILEIFELIKQKHSEKYADQWPLLVNITTNLVAGRNLLSRLITSIDRWAVSYHTEANDKQKKQMRDNLLFLKSLNANMKVTILMNPKMFDDAISMIEFCQENDIEYLPRQLDLLEGFDCDLITYDATQIEWFNNFYKSKTYNTENYEIESEESKNLTQVGRGCCGGRQFCVNGNRKQREFYIPNRFPGYSCSVNWFFLYIKQYTGNIYNNKDCRMRFDGTVGPIGNLRDSEKIIEELENQMNSDNVPIIKCVKEICCCGLCAPKAETEEAFRIIMPKYLMGNPFTTP
jgi:sulfatase maturation enzyme AslB (radical SAM superfamily)